MKRLILPFLLALVFSCSAAAQAYQLSTHILDIGAGKPAPGVTISLSRLGSDGIWQEIDRKTTDADGRIRDFLRQGDADNRGIYKLTFHTKPYFEARKQETFYPFIDVVFEIRNEDHFHVPITLSPFGYSTYRGS